MSMAVKSTGHREDKASNEHHSRHSTVTETLYGYQCEKSYSVTTHHNFSLDNEPRLETTISSPFHSVTEESHSIPVFKNVFSTCPSEVPPIPGSPTTSALLAFPLEIRRAIYFYALLPSPEYRQVLRPLRAKRKNSWWGTEEMSKVLIINRQLHWEMEEVLYSSFEFSFMETTPYNIQGFLDVLSPRARYLIQHVSCSITMNVRIRESIRQSYFNNWKACFEVMCKEMPGLRRIALQFRFLGISNTSSMRRASLESMMDLVNVFRSGQEVSLLPYDQHDGNNAVDVQGAEIVRECEGMIVQQRYSEALGIRGTSRGI
jgi:hypothetical protein